MPTYLYTKVAHSENPVFEVDIREARRFQGCKFGLMNKGIRVYQSITNEKYKMHNLRTFQQKLKNEWKCNV